jgi:hypothetical protein
MPRKLVPQSQLSIVSSKQNMPTYSAHSHMLALLFSNVKALVYGKPCMYSYITHTQHKMRTYVHTLLCVCVCVCVCMYIYMYIYIYIYIYIHPYIHACIHT